METGTMESCMVWYLIFGSNRARFEPISNGLLLVLVCNKPNVAVSWTLQAEKHSRSKHTMAKRYDPNLLSSSVLIRPPALWIADSREDIYSSGNFPRQSTSLASGPRPARLSWYHILRQQIPRWWAIILPGTVQSCGVQPYPRLCYGRTIWQPTADFMMVLCTCSRCESPVEVYLQLSQHYIWV